MLYKRKTINKITADREMAESNFYEPKYFFMYEQTIVKPDPHWLRWRQQKHEQ